MIEFFEDAERWFWAVHIIGTSFALGGATVTDLMFFRFLKNYRISEWEANTIALLSKLIWTGIGLLVISGIALYLPQAESLNESAAFLAKMSVVLVVIINGALLNFWMEPKLERISFLEEEAKKDEAIRPTRRRAFALGAISFVSWYGAFALAAIEVLPVSYLWAVSIYLAVVISAVIGSQLVERYLERKAPPTEAEL